MTLRLLNYRLHCLLGLGCSAFLILAGLTGAILVFEEEINTILHPEWHSINSRGPMASPDELLNSAQRALSTHQIRGLILPPQGSEKAAVARIIRKGNFGEAYIDPVTARFLGYQDKSWDKWVIQLHYSLLMGDYGMAFMFIPACGMILLSLGGLWIHRKAWKSLLTIPRFKKNARIGWSDLHKGTGVLLLVFNLLLGFTGAFFNWNAYTRLAQGKAFFPGKDFPGSYQMPAISLEEATRRAIEKVPDLQPIYYGFSLKPGTSLNLYGKVPGQSMFGNYSCQVALDGRTGEVKSVMDTRSMPWSQKWLRLTGPLHFGNFGGLPVKMLYSVCSLGLVVISISGLCIWRKRVSLPSRKRLV
jgi:uncharacterized iron-regulated membrane protein